MTENTDDKKKAATSETGDKKMPAKCDCKFNMNNGKESVVDGVEEVEGHVMDETVPVASKIDNTPPKKKACVLMEKKTPGIVSKLDGHHMKVSFNKSRLLFDI
eukprot:6246800-Ditylum_brightwellii.AAC.1